MSHWHTSSTAGEALKRIQEQVTCDICAQTFRDPKILECLHVYCRKCLDDQIFDPRSIACPSCGQATLLDPSGAAGLLPAFHIHSLLHLRDTIEKVASADSGSVRCEKCGRDPATAYCLSCWQCVCGECAEVHRKWRELASHELVGISHVRDSVSKLLPHVKNGAPPTCPAHVGRGMSIYCETCEKMVCVKCLSRQRHMGHAYKLAADAFESQRAVLEGIARALRNHLQEVDEAVLRFGPRVREVSDQRADVEEQIHGTILALHADLELRRTEFLQQLHLLAQQKLRTLEAQRRGVDVVRVNVERTLTFASQYLRSGSDREVVLMSPRFVAHADSLLAEVNLNSLVPLERADITFRPSGLRDMCAPGPCAAVRTTRVSPSHCRIADPTGCALGPTHSKVVTLKSGDAATFTVVIKDENGEDFLDPVNVTATLTLRDVAAECATEKTACGRYSVRCTPDITGRGVLNVCVDAQGVAGTPVPVVVRHPTQKVGEQPVMTLCGLKLPCGLDNGKQGDITVVVEKGAPRISIFNTSGTRSKMFGSRGSAPGQFCDPDGVTVDSSDNILVADSGNHRIQKFTAEGEFVAMVGTKGDGPLQFNLPTNIRIHPQTGNMYVCDQYNHRIQIVKEDFSYVGSFGKEGCEDGDFLYPTDLAFDGSGCVHVVDSKNSRIQVFTRGGRYLGQYMDKDGSSSLSPYSITIDASSDRVYVGEHTHCYSVFTSMGRFVASFGKKGSGDGDFTGPCRVATHLGLVYVSDSDSGRIQIF